MTLLAAVAFALLLLEDVKTGMFLTRPSRTSPASFPALTASTMPTMSAFESCAAAGAQAHLDVVLPLDLVTHVVLVAGRADPETAVLSRASLGVIGEGIDAVSPGELAAGD